MPIGPIQVLSGPVTDQDRALHFYTDVLGFELVADQLGRNGRWLHVAPMDAETGLVLTPGWPGMPDGSRVAFQLWSADVDGDCERLREAGVTVDGPRGAAWGRGAAFTDPDGNLISILQPRSADRSPAG